MKKNLGSQIVFFAALVVSGSVFAVDTSFLTAPPPTQVYHAVSGDSSSALQPAVTVSATTPTPAVVTSDTSNGAAIINSAGVDTALQGQAARLNQLSSSFEEKTDERIQNLNNSNHDIGIAIQSINQNIAQLQQQVNQLQAVAVAQSAAPSSDPSLALNHKKYSEYLDFGGAAIFMLGFGVVLGRFVRRRSPVVAHNRPEKEDTKGDYDFMGTAEAIPAKLDLARSYMVMKDYEQAAWILDTVLEKGNKEQRVEAQLLINKINSRKDDK